VENEHLKTTCIALNQKVIVMNDAYADTKDMRAHFEESERAREDLQTHIKETSVQIKTDKEEHKKYQDSLIEENQQQRDEIRKLKEQLVAKEK